MNDVAQVDGSLFNLSAIFMIIVGAMHLTLMPPYAWASSAADPRLCWINTQPMNSSLDQKEFLCFA